MYDRYELDPIVFVWGEDLYMIKNSINGRVPFIVDFPYA